MSNQRFHLAMVVLVLGATFSGAWATVSATPEHPATTAEVSAGRVDQEGEIAAFLSRFIRAFEDLDQPAFIACFSEDATVFYPPPEPRLRFDGRAAVQRHFELVFATIRAEASDGPPYHRIEPETLSVQLLGPDAAVVTFHLRLSGDVARRTLVLRKVEGNWSIAHLHASL